MFPPWVLTLITNYPDRFTNMGACWEAIIAEALRQASGVSSMTAFKAGAQAMARASSPWVVVGLLSPWGP
jgi:hypothetical protein